MTRTRILGVALLSAALIALFPATAGAGLRRQMLGRINSARSSGHIHRLRMSERLARGARAWAAHLMRINYLAHSSRAIEHGEGEIIEWHTGGRPNIRQVVSEWLNSPEHRTVMLARDYRRAGAGRAVGWLGGQRSTIWVVRFAR